MNIVANILLGFVVVWFVAVLYFLGGIHERLGQISERLKIITKILERQNK